MPNGGQSAVTTLRQERTEMGALPSDSEKEFKRLQRCMNNLVSVLALPAVWNGQEPRQIVTTFHDALIAMLDLDFVYTRGKTEADGQPSEVLGTASHSVVAPREGEIRQAIHERFGNDPQSWPAEMRSDVAGQEISLVSMRLGIEGEIGNVIAGSVRSDFPTETERLLLGVANNQAALALQQALALRGQKQLARELDRRVEERTRELAETNQELRITAGLLQLLPVAAWTLKPDGRPDFVNRVWLEYTGQTLDFVHSHPEAWMTAVHPDDRDVTAKAFWDGVRSGRGFEMEARALRIQDGTYRWHLHRAVVLRDAEGRVLKFVGTSTDIDDQKRAEDALRTSGASLLRVIDTIPTLSWCNLPDGPNEFLSRSWHEYTGLAPAESHGWGWQAAFHPDDLPPLLKKWQELLGSGEPGEMEARLRRYDGAYRWFLIRVAPFRDASGVIVRWYGTSTDIHDRKLVEEKLQSSEALLAEGQRLSRTGTFWWRVETSEITWSDELYRIFGFDPDHPVTIDLIRSRVHPEDMFVVGAMVAAAERAESSIEYEHRLAMPDGSVRHIHLIGHAVRGNGGLEYFGAAQDITRRKLAEEALTKARSELANVARATSLGVLTAAMAHEVSQPLAGILMNASTCVRMLDGDSPNVEGALETARRTIRDGNRASEVITKLRKLFSKKEVAVELFDLNEAAREVVTLMLADLQRNRLAIRQEFSDDLSPILGDRTQIQQVILNFLRNASDSLDSVEGRARQLIIRTDEDADSVHLAVRDTGVGFDGEAAAKLFEAFYTTKTGGMGIGLSVSRSIIEAHHGRIWAEANDGPGSTFAFSMPKASPAAAQSPDALPEY